MSGPSSDPRAADERLLESLLGKRQLVNDGENGKDSLYQYVIYFLPSGAREGQRLLRGAGRA
jgi:hypothetical protein